ncbi:putative KH domain-containing protein HEN4 [Cocos nucifera]|uniref:Putative KH domain-containing protein HEN4 n=1 Tax=Cocos nucifera TaxID=13894 RepID=A0A8K0HZ58_COCNU|nr:putative KH domain-containing protein HEN4 [Cocos nucifera]
MREAYGYPGPQTATGYPTMNSSVEVKIPNGAVAFRLLEQVVAIFPPSVRFLEGGLSCMILRLVHLRALLRLYVSFDQMKAAQSLLHTFIAPGGHNIPLAQAHRPY